MPPRRKRPPRAGALTELPPLKILRSILLLQISYYMIACILLIFTCIVFGQQFSVEYLLDWSTVRGDNTLGWTIGIVWIAVGFFSVIPILLLISRSKLVPDFSLTIHFLHLLVTTLYTKQLPTNLLWWTLQAGSSALMISLGVWACRYREMRPISFPTLEGLRESAIGNNKKNAQRKTTTEGSGPSYEMVAQQDEEG